MPKKKIPVTAIERDRAWIEAITNSLAKRGDSELSRDTMREAGRRCTLKFSRRSLPILGGPPNQWMS